MTILDGEPAPPGFHHIQREEMARLFGRVAWTRLAVLPLGVMALLWVAFTEASVWRRILLVGLAVLVPSFSAVEVARHRRQGLPRAAVPLNLMFAALVQAAATFATGGLTSPVLFGMFPIAMAAALTLRRCTPIVLLFQIVAVWFMAWLEAGGVIADFNLRVLGGGARSGWNDMHLYSNATFACVALVLIHVVGRATRSTFENMIRRTLVAQQDALRTHADATREMATLSGEIAHELKNPLASIKGLAGLLAQDAQGKAAERLGVLRHEVARMQGILGEFLDFSRPLSPLAPEQVDLHALSLEVTALHEGLAVERGLRLTVDGANVRVACDRRKIKQVLLNLVQNAFEASPAGTSVEIECAPLDDGGAVLRVLDRGPGLPAALADRVFEPGVTSKPQGSGLGLTIARALARQHQGTLELGHREGGGCVAELRLPGSK
jgi:signal transduction histidine kinase